MLSSGLGTAIALATLTALSLSGVPVGFVLCLLFHLKWSPRVAVWDALLSIASGIIYAFTLVAIATFKRPLNPPGLIWFFIVAAAAITVRHLIRMRQRTRA